MENDLLYQLALTQVRGIGAFHIRALINHFGTASAIFHTPSVSLEKIRGIGNVRAKAIVRFTNFRAAEKELAFLEKYKMRALFFTDAGYPRRLANDSHAPALLFYKGNADLNAAKIVAVIGTRVPTEYGKQAVENFFRELVIPGLLIVSGLAYGIDAVSHRAALKNHLPTVGVLGHGLNQIYPPQHAALAREMVRHGGLLTQFGCGTEPEEHNFPVRNRIVAGMSDAVIVVETGPRGGSMLTVENAITRRKKVFAFPYRAADHKSAGCNALIRDGKARLLLDPQQLAEEMGWVQEAGQTAQGSARLDPIIPVPIPPDPATQDPALPGEEKTILLFIREKGSVSMDELIVKSNFSFGTLAITLLNLELKRLIKAYPGKIYRPAK